MLLLFFRCFSTASLTCFGFFFFFFNIVRAYLGIRACGGRVYPNKSVSVHHLTLVKKFFCWQRSIHFQDRLNYLSKITFLLVSVFFRGFSFSTVTSGRKVFLFSTPFSVSKLIMLAEVLKEDQALAFLELISAYVNFSNSVIKRMTLVKWLAKGKTVKK